MLKMDRTTLVRTVLVVGTLSYCGLAVVNGMDRLSTTHRQAASVVPEYFAVNALAVRAQESLSSSPPEAIRLATKLVQRAPMEPNSTAILGEAYLAAGDDGKAERAFRVAGQLGWRYPATQDYWLGKALAAHNYKLAALHLDALLRLLPSLLNYDTTLASFENNLDARLALVQRLATLPPWLDLYTGEKIQVKPTALARRVPSLLLLADHGVILGCRAIAPAISDLESGGFKQEAKVLRLHHCVS